MIFDPRGFRGLALLRFVLKSTSATPRRCRGSALCPLKALFLWQICTWVFVRGERLNDGIDDLTEHSKRGVVGWQTLVEKQIDKLAEDVAKLKARQTKLLQKAHLVVPQAMLEENYLHDVGEEDSHKAEVTDLGSSTTTTTTTTTTTRGVPVLSPELRLLITETINTQRERMLKANNLQKLNVTQGASEVQMSGASATSQDLSENFVNSGIVFLRIQKTGSTSFASIATAQCRLLGVTKCDSYYHLDWNYVHNLLKSDPKRLIVTMLRNPVTRVISEGTFLKNQARYAQELQWDYTPGMLERLQEWRDINGSLADFSALEGNPANNRQVRYILGFERPATLYCYSKCEQKWDEFMGVGGLDPGSAIDDAIQNTGMNVLDVAMYRLGKEIHFFGLTECYESSLELANHVLGWNPSVTKNFLVRKLRSSGANYDSVTPEEVAQIKVANSLDMELLGFAREELGRRAEAKIGRAHV